MLVHRRPVSTGRGAHDRGGPLARARSRYLHGLANGAVPMAMPTAPAPGPASLMPSLAIATCRPLCLHRLQ